MTGYHLAEIEILKQDSTENLLGLALAIDVAKSLGDEKSVSDILTQFAAAYDTEIKREKVEHTAHSGTIEKLKKSASSLKAANLSNQTEKRDASIRH